MSTIEPFMNATPVPSYRTGGSRQSRQVARAHASQLAIIASGTEIRIATADATAQVQQAKADCVAKTGAYAMQQAALVSQMATQLALAAPAASGDLDYLKTLTVMLLGQVVTDTGRQVNRS